MLDEHACCRTSKRKANVDRSQECNEEKKEINDCKARFGHEFIKGKKIDNESNKNVVIADGVREEGKKRKSPRIEAKIMESFLDAVEHRLH